MNIYLEKKDVSDHQVFMSLYNDMVSENSSKAFRLACMAVIHALIGSNLKKDRIIRQLANSGVEVEEASHLVVAVLKILSMKGVLTAKGNLKVDAYLEGLEGKRVHHMHKAPVVWRSAEMGDLSMLPVLTKQHKAAMAEKHMPAVYQAMNGMQNEAFKFNKVIRNIPDWNAKMATHEWSYLEQSDWYLKGKLYFAQTFDFRGRMYYRGAFNPSNSGDLGKAMFKFAKGKVLGKQGMKALELHIANLAGIKGSIENRIQWSQEHALDMFSKVEGQKVSEIQKISGEQKIFQLYVALHEYQRVQRMGVASTSYLIIKQDGSCNGIQHSSAILRNADTARAVNICASDESANPEDIYQEYADALIQKLPAKWEPAISRSLAKKPTMVSGYGAGKKTVLFGKDGISDCLIENGYPELADELSDNEEIQELFISILEEIIQPIVQLINIVRSALKDRPYAPITWLTLDRFPVRMESEILIDDCFDELQLSRKQSLKLRNFHPKELNAEASSEKIASSLAVNLIHSLDATHLRMVARTAHDKNISFMHTHDEFGCHASDFFALNKIIRSEFVNLHNHDAFDSINHRNNLNIQIRIGSYDLNEALAATYMFS